MIALKEFLEFNPLDKKIGTFPERELLELKGKIPTDLLEFLNQEQKSIYGNGFFWTILPADYHDILNNWGLDGDNCYAFLRSSFGCIVYWSNEKCYGLNVQDGSNNPITGNDITRLFNFTLTWDINLEVGFCYDLHIEHRDNLPELKEDEMYTLVPSLPLGGDRETSKVEVVKIREQLDILAQLFDHKTTD